ncbi:AMP-binding protein [Chelativorans sp. ZYF759]|uniref:AMP-binding protein n=1 Tax=Chelativorans sp. ZYF759 TaxID=2692213 RepID=UPI00145D1B97|nr:AMP-binding protein [Chelativorans sp. ZYF759]NMG41689.1 AMP-binding protein [Chelativorans sp. ZYF759]
MPVEWRPIASRRGSDASGHQVGATLAEARRRWPDSPALIMSGRSATHDEIWRQSETCAKALIAHGIGPHENVGIYLPNSWEYVILFNAVTMIGACAVALNARFREHELSYAVRKADLCALFTSTQGDGNFDGRKVLLRAFPEILAAKDLADLHPSDAPTLKSVFLTEAADDETRPSWKEFLGKASAVPQAEFDRMFEAVSPEDDCLIMFSSGTTADPKACRLSHRALTLSGEGMARRFHLSSQDRFWDPLPFFHMSTMLPLAACRSVGACFIGVSRFEAGAALEEIERTRATIAYPAFSTITTAMMAHPDFAARDLSVLRLVLNVGPPDLLRKFQAAFPRAVQVSCYGLTECGGLSCYNELDETLEQRVTTSGRPIDGVEARIADLATGGTSAEGGTGEIQLRGTTLFSGYYGDEARTREAMTADGWLRTGDIGTIDADGRVRYVGRFKDMLRIGGENVAAAEIESFLTTHPAIRLAQVVGVPDGRLDEVAAAFVELENGAALTEIDVARFCAHRIASYKIPRYVRFVHEWPMSATKIQKFRLRENFAPDRMIDVSALLKAGR